MIGNGMRNLVRGAVRVLAIGALMAISVTGSSLAQDTGQSQSSYSEAWSRYITPDELNVLMTMDSGVQVIDIRKEKYVKKGAIAGALAMPFKAWRGPKHNPGQPPTEEELEALMGEMGLDLERPIVVHSHTGKTIQTGRAAIIYWILKSSGAEKIAILNGGFKAWRAQGLPETLDLQKPEPTTVDLTYQQDWWASPIQVFGVASGQTDGAILDARLDAQVKKSIKTGKPLQSLPMARFIPASFFMNPLSDKNTTQEAQSSFVSALTERGVALDKGFLISVCQTGELSALSWFYASEIVGIEKVLYYPDALKGWKNDGGLLFGLNPS